MNLTGVARLIFVRYLMMEKICKAFAQYIYYEDFPITYIEWSENETDKIKCHFNRTENSVVCDKVWFNQELVYPNDTKDRIFKIIK